VPELSDQNSVKENLNGFLSRALFPFKVSLQSGRAGLCEVFFVVYD
jgi:hypothetical protein